MTLVDKELTSLDSKFTIFLLNILFIYFLINLTCRIISMSGKQKPADLDLHCFQNRTWVNMLRINQIIELETKTT